MLIVCGRMAQLSFIVLCSTPGIMISLQAQRNENSVAGLNNRTGTRVDGIGKVTQRYADGVKLGEQCTNFRKTKLIAKSFYNLCDGSQIVCVDGSFNEPQSVPSSSSSSGV